MYIADSFNNRIRKVTISSGIISTVAGTGSASYGGDNGQATSAMLNIPMSVALDSAGISAFTKSYFFASYCFLSLQGDVYITDYYNFRIRKVALSTGIISTFAGTGSSSYSGDGGAATSAGLNPWGVAIDTTGNVYLTDFSNNRIRKVTVITSSPSTIPTAIPTTNMPVTPPTIAPSYATLSPASTQGIITTIAGNSGDTAATSAILSYPRGVAIDSAGYLISSFHRLPVITIES